MEHPIKGIISDGGRVILLVRDDGGVHGVERAAMALANFTEEERSMIADPAGFLSQNLHRVIQFSDYADGCCG